MTRPVRGSCPLKGIGMARPLAGLLYVKTGLRSSDHIFPRAVVNSCAKDSRPARERTSSRCGKTSWSGWRMPSVRRTNETKSSTASTMGRAPTGIIARSICWESTKSREKNRISHPQCCHYTIGRQPCKPPSGGQKRRSRLKTRPPSGKHELVVRDSPRVRPAWRRQSAPA